MPNQRAISERLAPFFATGAQPDVDSFGVPLDAFGSGMEPQFFEILGRVLAVNGKIEYLKDRLEHIPPSETLGVRKVEQFFKRYNDDRQERNAIVHSHWIRGAHTQGPEILVGVRYKSRNKASGTIARVSITDVPGSEREQVLVEYTLGDLRKQLKKAVTTMLIGTQACSEVSMNWAFKQTAIPTRNP